MQAILLFLILSVPFVNAFSWGSERRAAVGRTPDRPSSLLHNSRLPSIYAVALSELQELESEPLCHRVAARLLVNNCQLVDGKDEATILTDSGRQVRDFVDSYAASLAICDLERGRFSIPKECAKFREPSLSQIAIRHEAQLHVSPAEIGLCLSALAASDAAWSTWVSYRHKALRFCEAARVDNEKAQNILLYQRLTRVVSQLTDGVEAELQKRMDDLDARAWQSVEKLEQLAPQIGRLGEGLARVESYLSGDLGLALKKTSESSRDGLETAQNLQHLLSILLGNVLENNAELASAHEQSLQQASQRVNNDMGTLIEVVSTALASSTSLQQQLHLTSERTTALEAGLSRLAATTDSLTTTVASQTTLLQQARNITSDILDTLEETAATASAMGESFLLRVTARSWWPFVVFPAASLVLGSYGLPPSLGRNVALVVAGVAVAGVMVEFERIGGVVGGVWEMREAVVGGDGAGTL
ncbi:hypothetical protein C8A05DRAFT_34121 [Staphylotrichum tortipilum]|uniref:Nuclear fusion protein KAR5 n=1 Tax=Staphylotrichum tortipilum TaxID=2831512 RepID=A0AAN6MJS4_9PEZI|nr:hypothetical protein C8A05DRAFT_34121 [Staphylotrichum longicolle]